MIKYCQIWKKQISILFCTRKTSLQVSTWQQKEQNILHSPNFSENIFFKNGRTMIDQSSSFGRVPSELKSTGYVLSSGTTGNTSSSLSIFLWNNLRINS